MVSSGRVAMFSVISYQNIKMHAVVLEVKRINPNQTRINSECLIMRKKLLGSITNWVSFNEPEF